MTSTKLLHLMCQDLQIPLLRRTWSFFFMSKCLKCFHCGCTNTPLCQQKGWRGEGTTTTKVPFSSSLLRLSLHFIPPPPPTHPFPPPTPSLPPPPPSSLLSSPLSNSSLPAAIPLARQVYGATPALNGQTLEQIGQSGVHGLGLGATAAEIEANAPRLLQRRGEVIPTPRATGRRLHGDAGLRAHLLCQLVSLQDFRLEVRPSPFGRHSKAIRPGRRVLCTTIDNKSRNVTTMGIL